jgi:chemotaxis protein histidine kinase CheA
MSVKQEHLKIGHSGSSQDSENQTDRPPKLEYSVSGDDSLTAYWAAIGGAVLGALLTLLVLAIINGGTLRFTDENRLAALEASLTRVDENVGAVNHNVEVVTQRLDALETEAGAISQIKENLNSVEASLAQVDESLQAQEAHLSELDDAVSVLDVTRQQFDVFTSALAQALTEMGVVPSPAVEAPAPTAPQSEIAPSEEAPVQEAPMNAVPSEEAPAASEETPAVEAPAVEAPAASEEAPVAAPAEEAAVTEAPAEEAASEAGTAEAPVAEAPAPALSDVAPVVVSTADVPADAVVAYFFVDANGNGVKDDSEASLVGIAVGLQNADGEELASLMSNDNGAEFTELAPGKYVVVIKDALGFTLATSDRAEVTVTEDATEGQVVYFPVSLETGQ